MQSGEIKKKTEEDRLRVPESPGREKAGGCDLQKKNSVIK